MWIDSLRTVSTTHVRESGGRLPSGRIMHLVMIEVVSVGSIKSCGGNSLKRRKGLWVIIGNWLRLG